MKRLLAVSIASFSIAMGAVLDIPAHAEGKQPTVRGRYFVCQRAGGPAVDEDLAHGSVA